jgi:hypothetical protein
LERTFTGLLAIARESMNDRDRETMGAGCVTCYASLPSRFKSIR